MKKKDECSCQGGGMTPSPSVPQGFTPSLYIFSRGK
nr:MAG TPA: hypothetical protein [Caudoviricetes sp.]